MSELLSWGRYPRLPQTPHAAHWRDQAQAQWRGVQETHGTTLAFGNGRSYGDVCLASSDHVFQTLALDRIISADWTRGIVRAEPGITFEQILAVAVPRGWMLPVTPGTKYVTLGGAIANDVHGKNHHVRGTFGRHVRAFGLARSDGTVLECSPDTNPEWFKATIGGLGLTGLILWAEFALMPIRTSLIDVTSIRFGKLDEFFDLSEEYDAKHEYCVAWVDCASRGASLGRGIFMAGDHAIHGSLDVEQRRKRSVPFTPPVSLINGLTLRAFNELYYRKQRKPVEVSRVGYDGYFYPLDSLLEWNRIYGPAGFQQYQCVVPAATARDAVRAMLDRISSSGTGSFLAVLKRCGDIASPGLLSFPMEGTSLALDFPQHDARNAPLFAALDTLVREAGGRIYPAKDAHMSAADFRAAYPQWQQLESLRDPAMLSHFWKRMIAS
ncbi:MULTISPECIES: FAD-binding oxidoreductase [unclassified Caballeronia]|uniref:FAD-binding oxidoreductase n=1 Tax=unclassified Caballeronia TaxID=2646786 RepID=UPI00285F4707|nr:MULTISPECIES: FAD-binding oxidoreductase [unclassified Caballeronia]MDR5814321.1 FAD-binding oxidoreductase [Caballeronia sp. LZ033]MDR5878899.1 FAD-binding oxidoreductase [Caballeronia sp. LZ032]